MPEKNNGVRFRSKYARYRWKGVAFENNIATVTDPRTVERMKADPHFGEGRDFWEDTDPPAPPVTTNATDDGDDKGGGGGDGKPTKPATTKGKGK